MNETVIQANGFENLFGFVILILWVAGKVLSSRAEKKKPPEGRPAAPGPEGRRMPRPPPMRGPDMSPEEELRRFLAQLSGAEPPPGPIEIEVEEEPVFALPPPAPLPPPPPPRRRAVAPFGADREARRRGSAAVTASSSYSDARDVIRQARAAAAQSSPPMRIMRQSTRSTGLPSSAMTGRILMGPRLSMSGSASGRGSGSASASLRSALHSPRRVREAFLLREVLSAPRAFDGL